MLRLLFVPVIIRTLEVGEVALLVEAGLVQAEGVDDVDDLVLVVLDGLLGLLGGSIATGVCVQLVGKVREYGGPECALKVSPPMVIFRQSTS